MKNSPAMIETYTGIMFDMLDPKPRMIDIRDIAHAGSLLCRWTGHTKYHYSIAQHELLGSYIVPEEFALEFLMHDAAESYVNDMSRPLKHMTDCGKHYRPVEDRIQSLIRTKYGLPKVQSPVIHEIDNAMLLAEKQQIMGNAIWSKKLTDDCLVSGAAAKVKIVRTPPEDVEFNFLKRFKELTKRRK